MNIIMKNIIPKNIEAPVKLLGMGHYFPGDPIDNKMIEQKFGFSANWIVEHTGVHTRHWVDNNEISFVDLAKNAAMDALEKANLDKDEIDILICTSATARPVYNPSTTSNKYMDIAPPLQRELGLNNVFCFDLTAVACLGFVNISMAAASLLHSMNKKNALIVCVESPKNILNFKYKNSTLFGAGAAAAIWQICDKEESDLIDVVIHSDGKYFEAFDIDDENKVLMKGKEVGEVAPKVLTEVTEEILSRNKLEIKDVDWFIPHQANINIIKQLKEKLKIPEEKLLVNIDKRGNTSSVGGPGCCSEFIDKGTIKHGDLILTCSIGRGFSWGGILFKC